MDKSYSSFNVADIKPYQKNPRKNDDAVESVRKSIEQCGYIAPIVIDEDNIVLAGHTRLKALKEMGIKTADVVRVAGLTDEQKRKYRLLDNKTAELSAWDFDALAEEIEGLDFGDLELDWGIDLDPDPIQTEEDDYSEGLPEEPVSKRGDIYQLGQHTLMCGDSTEPEDVKKLMRGGAGTILFTSPPYSDLREYSKGMDVSIEKLSKFIGAFEPYTDIQCVNLGIKFKDKEVVRYWDDYINSAYACGYKLMAWNVWDKGNAGSVGAESAFFPLAHEWIFVFAKERKEINRTVEKNSENVKHAKETRTVRQADGTMKTSNAGDQFHRLKRMNSVSHIGMEHNNNSSLKEHPARFPVELPAEYIKALTNEGESVIDCFGGTGTTLIACEQLNRNCYMMELEPKFVDIIIDRWEAFTGKKAVKLNG